ncbi:MAG: DUF3822 family protein [Bacteroidetes bacterium]|nr:DUF3822 family protein [Bacteroidota bacterium]
MDKLSYQYLDHDFDPEHTGDYTLLMQADEAQFTVAVTDQHKLLLLSNPLSSGALSGSGEGTELLFRDYSQRIAGLSFTGFTIIPLSLFNPEKTADFARFLDVKPDEKVFSQPLDDANQVIFKAGEKLVSAVGGKFSTRNIVFAARGWITAVAENNPPHTSLYLNLMSNKVDVLNFSDNKLRFYNRFGFGNADELAYFISLAAHELQLQPQELSLVVSGDVTHGDDNISRLSDFFGKVEINDLQLTGLPEQVDPHSVLSLTALALCASSVAH